MTIEVYSALPLEISQLLPFDGLLTVALPLLPINATKGFLSSSIANDICLTSPF